MNAGTIPRQTCGVCSMLSVGNFRRLSERRDEPPKVDHLAGVQIVSPAFETVEITLPLRYLILECRK